jgi:hypothetical protein
MRRPVSLAILSSILIVFAALFGSYSAPSSAQESEPVCLAGPPANEYSPGVWVTDLGAFELPPEPDGGTPPPGTPEPPELRLKRVCLEQDTNWPSASHGHDGSFVLSVEAGAICYTYLEPIDSVVTVTAKVSEDTAIPAACSGAQTDCGGTAGCVLLEGESVYLPEGSSIHQSGSAQHRYGNVDTELALVYLAEYQPATGGAGCGGTCP